MLTIRARRQTDTGQADLMILQGREKGSFGIRKTQDEQTLWYFKGGKKESRASNRHRTSRPHDTSRERKRKDLRIFERLTYKNS